VPLSRARDYLSIGEVLEAIRPDFPDVSISKIRFLENEGLIAPERTPSGYRKFYDPDIARLRYVLTLQRDQFLPLKVIKERLASWDGVSPPGSPPAEEGDGAPVDTAGEGGDGGSGKQRARLTREELRQAAGISEAQVAGLEDFALLSGSDGYFDGDDVTVARTAAALFDYGLEPRHMRMFRHSADREGALIEQIIAPVVRKRNPEARREAAAAARDLLALAERMRAALLRSRLRDLV
jgi:DNA-binding transcriptional MerR regulator